MLHTFFFEDFKNALVEVVLSNPDLPQNESNFLIRRNNDKFTELSN